MEETINRYVRQIAVPEIGKEGQKRICNSAVLIIGCGALGSMVAMQLAGAGVGTVGIADFDTVDITNLQRQFFFTTYDAGKSKVDILEKRIMELNPEVKVNVYNKFIIPADALKIFSDYDFIIDATDNPESKRMTGEISKKSGKPCCIGGVRDFRGQIMTFLPEDSRFEDYFGKTSGEGFLPCSLSGVMGSSAAVCASLQASEAIKYIVKKGELLSGKIMIFNLLDNSFSQFSI